MVKWKWIKDYEGLYNIDTEGRVYSTRKNGYLCLNLAGYKYWVVRLFKNKTVGVVTIHKLLLKTFVPNPNGYLYCNHKDGNKLNNNLSNLEWCTASQNTKHAFKIGLRNQKGENNAHHKLTEIQVTEIRKLKNKMKRIDVASKFKVTPGNISFIWKNKIWKYV